MASGDIVRLGGGTDFLKLTRNDLEAYYTFTPSEGNQSVVDKVIIDITGSGIVLSSYLYLAQVATVTGGVSEWSISYYVDDKLVETLSSSSSGGTVSPKSSTEELFYPFKKSVKVLCSARQVPTAYFQDFRFSAIIKYLS